LEEEKVKSNKTEVKKEEKSCHKFGCQKRRQKHTKAVEKKIRLEDLFCFKRHPKQLNFFFKRHTDYLQTLTTRLIVSSS